MPRVWRAVSMRKVQTVRSPPATCTAPPFRKAFLPLGSVYSSVGGLKDLYDEAQPNAIQAQRTTFSVRWWAARGSNPGHPD
jgi:hypothetical protein